MAKFKKYNGFQCTMIFDTIYQRVSKEIRVKGYLIKHEDIWLFCMTQDHEKIKSFFGGIDNDDYDDFLKLNIKTLAISASDLLPIGNQHKNSPTFGHFINTFR